MPVATNYHQIAEVLSSGPTAAYNYQQIAEVLSTGPTSAYNYQSFAEVLIEKTNTAVQTWQTFVEVLHQKDQATCFNYHTFVELLIQYDPTVSISDRAYAADGFYGDAAGEMTIDDYGTEATFEVSGTFESLPDPGDEISISDLAIATSTFIAENPTLISITDLAVATSTISTVGQIRISDEAIASSRLQTILNNRPGLLSEDRYPW